MDKIKTNIKSSFSKLVKRYFFQQSYFTKKNLSKNLSLSNQKEFMSLNSVYYRVFKNTSKYQFANVYAFLVTSLFFSNALLMNLLNEKA
ncbi:hypothetical protein BTO16_17015 [Polaribacter glomeratus]|uniref:Uncharacterized protein n=1 Tax=Polaribacter glomeratus TaxID=102 RepID=A0A2S7WIT1_9FLAO|nr:hypothetical protein BTO16_17015 [Polaribacter glomeratus]